MIFDKRCISIKFENFNMPMEARIYMALTDVYTSANIFETRTSYEVWFRVGENERWNLHRTAGFHDAFTLVADLSIMARS